jgi:hypothetical protein
VKRIKVESMNSIKKCALQKIKKVLEGPEGPSQEELERNVC